MVSEMAIPEEKRMESRCTSCGYALKTSSAVHNWFAYEVYDVRSKRYAPESNGFVCPPANVDSSFTEYGEHVPELALVAYLREEGRVC